MKDLLTNIVEAFSVSEDDLQALIDLLKNPETPQRVIQKIFLTAFNQKEQDFIAWCKSEKSIANGNAAEIVDKMRRVDNLEAVFNPQDLAVLSFSDINQKGVYNLYNTIIKKAKANKVDFIDNDLIEAIGKLSGKDASNNGIGCGEYLVTLFTEDAHMSGSAGGDAGDVTIGSNHVEVKANGARLNGQVAALNGAAANIAAMEFCAKYNIKATNIPLAGSTSELYKWLAKADEEERNSFFTSVLPSLYDDDTSEYEKAFIEMSKKVKLSSSKEAMELLVFFCEYVYSTLDKFHYLLVFDKEKGTAYCLQTVHGGNSLDNMWKQSHEFIRITSGINNKGRQAAPQLNNPPV